MYTNIFAILFSFDKITDCLPNNWILNELSQVESAKFKDID